MTYPYDASTLAALTRLSGFYNGNAYNAGSNPGGMAAGGHRINFIPSLQDLTLVGTSVEDAADSAATSASNASSSASTAASQAAALTATSTTSRDITTGAKAFVTQASKGFDVGSWVQVTSDANPTTHYMIGQVTSYNGVDLTINVTQLGSGTGTRADWTILGRTGAPGPTGASGSPGAQGVTVALNWLFNSATADADPGNGVFRANNASLASTTNLYIDNLDNDAASQTTWLDALDDSTNTALRGTLYLMRLDAPANFVLFNVTGAVVDGTGYRKVPVTYVSGNGSFASGNEIGFIFTRTGDKGTDGAGSGDVISDVGTAVDGQICIANGTTGKHVRFSSFAIGTTGAAVGALSTANTWGGNQTFNASLIGAADFLLSGDITPAQITSNQNDYAPTGIATASVLRLSTDASHNITGITTGADGRVLVLANVGSFDIVLINDATSTAANRFLIGADYTLAPGQTIAVIYDSTSVRWRPLESINGLAASGGVARPSYSFSGDPDTGLYNVSSNVVGLSCGGTNYFQVSSTQVDINVATDASSATAAALVIDGGLGVAKKAYFADIVNVAGQLNANGGISITGAFAISTINLTGGQIAFPATQAASADANTLDDYEEGTFTPGAAFGGSATGFAYSTQVGRYTKVGRVVHFTIDLAISTTGSGTGAYTITGLPFTSAAGINTACALWISGLSGGSNSIIEAHIGPSSTVISLTVMDYGMSISYPWSTALTDANYLPARETATPTFRISGTYFV